MKRLPILGITMGDPAGIGPEVVVKSIINPQVKKVCIPLVFGSKDVFSETINKYAKGYKLNQVYSVKELNKDVKVINVLHCTDLDYKKVKTGKVNKTSGSMAATSVVYAVQFALAQEIDGIVTAPLSKKGLKLAGYDFPGQTEMIAFLTASTKFGMMFIREDLKLILVTTHLPLAGVSREINSRKVFEKIELLDKVLRFLFRTKSPKIAVCALNPHSGEEGLFGKEEKRAILPAIKKAQKRDIKAFGPFAADSIFNKELSSKFDCIVAMYHDQGLIPMKINGVGSSVNLTVGIPIIRTSPDFGTALNIAGKGKADPEGMIKAINLAVDLTKSAKKLEKVWSN
ncbi:MAG: 4-hydroxythreonine-4-phosphate dehydrogenase PdxA [candidate division Zixibacteria bacterium]|nr:4-hydroxythreonine-4-phosphate dehydrogenase PdxA [candidate division Zixibacteria bacterium]